MSNSLWSSDQKGVPGGADAKQMKQLKFLENPRSRPSDFATENYIQTRPIMQAYGPKRPKPKQIDIRSSHQLSEVKTANVMGCVFIASTKSQSQGLRSQLQQDTPPTPQKKGEHKPSPAHSKNMWIFK